MGMYTGPRGTIVIKSELREQFNSVFEWYCTESGSTEGFWERILPDRNAYLNKSRRNVLLLGKLLLGEQNYHVTYNVNNGKLEFTNSLKNHDLEIDTIINEVLPTTAESWQLNYQDKESDGVFMCHKWCSD